jgi:DNA-binding transcriptional LysR family regulator
MLNLKRLEHFLVVAQERSFVKAAQRLHLSPPALTRSIQTLEEALDLLLIDRSHDGLTLTDAGEHLLQSSTRVLAEAQNLKREAELLRGVQSGHVSFGVGVFPAATFLSEVLMRQARECPGLNVEVDISSWKKLSVRLERHELDFAVALTMSLPPSPEFEILTLPDQQFGFFVRTGHPMLSCPGSEQQQQLHKHKLIAPNLPLKAKERLERIFGQLGLNMVPYGLSCDNVDVLKNVALGSDQILFATRESLSTELASGRLQELGFLRYDQDQSTGVSVVYSRHRSLSPAARWFMAAIGEALQRG